MYKILRNALQASMIYTALGLISGIFYRDFTKYFTNETNLGLIHSHLFVLGTVFMLILAICIKVFKIHPSKTYIWFFYTYNIGLVVTFLSMTTRGVLQAINYTPIKALDTSIAGISGIGHILLSVGLILFFMILNKSIGKDQNNQIS